MARFGKVFFLVTDDPVQYRIDLFADEPPPRSLDREFEAVGGSIRLAVPSGRMVLRGWNKAGEAVEAGAISVSAGTCLLSVMTRRSFDGARHVEDMERLLGADWRFMQRVDRLGLVGCLPFGLTAICLVAGRWPWPWYLVPLLVVSWLPYLVLKRSRRYQTAARRAREEEQARPHHVFSLTPSERHDLPGGFLRV